MDVLCSLKVRVVIRVTFTGLLLGALTACGPVTIRSDPSTFPVPPSAAAQVRGQRSVALNNGYPSETVVTIRSGSMADWQGDLRQYTETALTMLSGEMTKKGVDVSAKAPKSVTLRVSSVNAEPGAFTIRASVTLEATYGDGSKSTVRADNSSPADAHRAMSGAIMFAVIQLLGNDAFLKYVNR